MISKLQKLLFALAIMELGTVYSMQQNSDSCLTEENMPNLKELIKAIRAKEKTTALMLIPYVKELNSSKVTLNPLCQATLKDLPEVVNKLIEYGANVNLILETGNSALTYVHSPEVLQLYLDNKADISLGDSKITGLTFLQGLLNKTYILENKMIQMIQLLINNARGDSEILIKLINNAIFSKNNNTKITAISLAKTYWPHAPKITELLEILNKSDINDQLGQQSNFSDAFE